MSSKSKESVEIDEVADYLLSSKRTTKISDKKLDTAIEAHKTFVTTFKRYKQFYETHQRSHYKIQQDGAESQSSKVKFKHYYQ